MLREREGYYQILFEIFSVRKNYWDLNASIVNFQEFRPRGRHLALLERASEPAAPELERPREADGPPLNTRIFIKIREKYTYFIKIREKYWYFIENTRKICALCDRGSAGPLGQPGVHGLGRDALGSLRHLEKQRFEQHSSAPYRYAYFSRI